MPRTATNAQTLRLGTRGSQLARCQSEWVADRLRQLGHTVHLVEIATRGDVERHRSIEEIGTRGVFTKEIQRALLAGDVDVAVHSLKDLPTEPVEGLMVAAVPKRESPRDVLVCAVARVEPASDEAAFEALGARLRLDPSHPVLRLTRGARVGTGSLRRQAQLKHLRPDFCVGDVRGNVETRLRKLDEGQFDAIVLAEAGLRRLGLATRITTVLPFDVMLPAVGQGALGIECRADDTETRTAVLPLDDSETSAAVMAERALLAHLLGGCMAPVGALGRVESDELRLSAVVLSMDGSQRLWAEEVDSPAKPQSLGERVAEALLAQGAAQLIAASRTR
jgi:hydroxymethylbilane synthase